MKQRENKTMSRRRVKGRETSYEMVISEVNSYSNFKSGGPRLSFRCSVHMDKIRVSCERDLDLGVSCNNHPRRLSFLCVSKK